MHWRIFRFQERHGSSLDLENIKACLKSSGFVVEVFLEFSTSLFWQVLEHWRERLNGDLASEYSGLLVYVGSYGDEAGLYGVDGTTVYMGRVSESVNLNCCVGSKYSLR